MEKGRLTDEFKAYLESNGYFDLKEVDGKILGLMRFMYTIAIVVDIDSTGYSHRYCYPNERAFSCLVNYKHYKGEGDPGGHWLVRKGRGGDYRNPNLGETN
jgi:hypothetical protein